MFNLLPGSIKREIVSEYRIRRVVVILIFVILTQILTMISLFPSWVVSRTREQGVSLELEKTRKSDLSSDANGIKDKIKLINNEVNLLSTSLEYPRLSPFIDYVLSKKTSSIKLNSFSYNDGNSWTLSIKGVSSSRESLVEFVDSLKSENIFKSVDLPVSNLAKNRNIDFSITLNI